MINEFNYRFCVLCECNRNFAYDKIIKHSRCTRCGSRYGIKLNISKGYKSLLVQQEKIKKERKREEEMRKDYCDECKKEVSFDMIAVMGLSYSNKEPLEYDEGLSFCTKLCLWKYLKDRK